VYIIYTMADKKISQFDTFPGAADDEVFFVVASGDADNPNASNYRYPFTSLTADITNAGSAWVTGTDLIYTLTGAVGLGTTAPIHQLDVATTGRFRSDLIVSGDLYVSGTTHVQKIIDVSITGTISGTTGEFADGIFSDSLMISGVSVSTGGSMEVPGGGGSVIGGDVSNINFGGTEASDARAVNFQVGGVDKLVIGSDGNVRIAEDLTVSGMLYVHNSDGGDATDKASMLSEAVMKLQPHATNSTNMLFAQVSDGSAVGMQVTNYDATANYDIALNPFGGKVGIGSTNPNAQLEILSDGSLAEGAEIRLQHGNNNATDVLSTVNFANNIGSVAMIQAGTVGANNNGYISFFTDDAGSSDERMRINSDGNVGIGTGNPVGKLHVLCAPGGGNDALVSIETPSSNAEMAVFQVKNPSDILFRVNQGGNVGIGTVSPTSLLTLSGDNEDLRIVTDVGGTSVTVVGLMQDASNNGSIEVNNSVGNNKVRLRSTGVSVTAVSGAFTESLTVSGNSVLTGAAGGGGGGGGGQWTDVVGVPDIYYNAGKVGIGNVAPAFDLDLGDGSSSEQLIRLRRGAGDVNQWSEIGYRGVTTKSNNVLASDQTPYFIDQKGSDGTRRAITINAGGKVGIGTTTPGAQLHVSGSTIISGSSEITLDYDRLPKSNPDIKGRVWIHEVSGLFMVSSGIAPDVPTIIIIQPMRMVSAGPGEHSLFLTTAGNVYACGFNNYGQLGDGTLVNKHVPTYITGDVTGISAGEFYSMFLSTSSESYACGRNNYGQFGDGTTADKYAPTYITGDVTGISAGLDHSVFLSTSSESYACGHNFRGQLGDGTIIDKHVPTHTTGDVAGISAGGYHSMFLSTSSESYACGLNSQGQLGNGLTSNKLFPTHITGDVTGISAGTSHSVFLSTSSESYACGQNFYGQLGDGTTNEKLSPTHITGDVTGVSAGHRHSMFLSTSSESYACGSNFYGQFGDGTTADKYAPTYITGDVTGVAAGGYHSMFFSTGSEFYACGLNGQGQLGDGTTVDKDVPTYISGQGA
jgi:alpha-tubulin suppressor-like RCC1 family protein